MCVGGCLDVGDHCYVWSFISCFTGSVLKKRIMMFLTHTTFYIEIVLMVYILDVAVVCSLEVWFCLLKMLYVLKVVSIAEYYFCQCIYLKCIICNN